MGLFDIFKDDGKLDTLVDTNHKLVNIHYQLFNAFNENYKNLQTEFENMKKVVAELYEKVNEEK